MNLKKSKAGRVLGTRRWNPELVTPEKASEAGRFLGQLPRKQEDKKPKVIRLNLTKRVLKLNW